MRNRKLWFGLRLLLNVAALAVVAVRSALQMCNGSMFSPKWAFSVGFVALALLNLIGQTRREWRFSAAFVAGLVLSAIGDVCIDNNFVTGAVAFGLGHVCFFLGCCVVLPIKLGDIAAMGGVFLTVAAFVLLQPQLADTGCSGLFLVYALVISLFLGKAAANLARKADIGNAVTALGALLFFLSDVLLAIGGFTALWEQAGQVSLGLYYLAVYLLAATLAARGHFVYMGVRR